MLIETIPEYLADGKEQTPIQIAVALNENVLKVVAICKQLERDGALTVKVSRNDGVCITTYKIKK